jgi:hypothetical protein
MMQSEKLLFLKEPLLQFGYGQILDDPRTGLLAFGPLEDRRPGEINVGVIGTPESVAVFRDWWERVRNYIPSLKANVAHHISFPGLEVAFKVGWKSPVVEIPVSQIDLSAVLRSSDRHKAIYDTVSQFEGPIRRRLVDDDLRVDVWFVVVPEEVFLLGRPKSRVPLADQVPANQRMNTRLAKRLQKQPSLFAEDMVAAEAYKYDLNFHHQLKARLLETGAVVQVVRESTLAPNGFDSLSGSFRSRQDDATVAWNLCTTTFFKAGGRPWKLASMREGVCYIGVVFKRHELGTDGSNACCGAQMFLDSGDGMVFKGAMGPWFSSTTKEFHLSASEAGKLINRVIDAYTFERGSAPRELFIHGRAKFNDEEAAAFQAAAPAGTEVSCVCIKRSSELKIYGSGVLPVLRGTALKLNSRKVLLWTTGYVPFLETYPGREVPNPLSIEITHGGAKTEAVLADVLSLTKLNFNACIYSDGLPVTLRFADAVGEILTAAPLKDLPPLPFRHYI